MEDRHSSRPQWNFPSLLDGSTAQRLAPANDADGRIGDHLQVTISSFPLSATNSEVHRGDNAFRWESRASLSTATSVTLSEDKACFEPLGLGLSASALQSSPLWLKKKYGGNATILVVVRMF